MRLPSLKRIVLGDYTEDEQPLVNKLASTLNIGLESLYEALNNKLTVRENFKGMIKDVVVGTDGKASSFELSPNGTVDVLWVGKVMAENGDSIIPPAAPFVSWRQEQNSIVITDIKGLGAGTSYKLRLVLLYN